MSARCSVTWKSLVAGCSAMVSAELDKNAKFGHLVELPTEAVSSASLCDLPSTEARGFIRGRFAKYMHDLSIAHHLPVARAAQLCCLWRLDAIDSPIASDLPGGSEDGQITLIDKPQPNHRGVCSMYTANDAVALQSFDKASGDSKPHRRACSVMLLQSSAATKYFAKLPITRVAAPKSSLLPEAISTSSTRGRRVESLRNKMTETLDTLEL